MATSLVWDNHACFPLRPFDESFLPQLERYRTAGINVIGINVGFGEQSAIEHVRMLATFRRWLAGHSDLYEMVYSADDIVCATRSGKLGVFFDIEGVNAVETQLSLIQLYYDLGVRWMCIAYNRTNRAGGGCLEEDNGLTDFGVQVVGEMNRVGMVPCCSHTGYKTSADVISCSSSPVIFSHSNPRELHDHPRNLPDELMKACASRGGIVGINGVGAFVGNNDIRPAAVANHIDYAVQLIGIEHVAIGLDYVLDLEDLRYYLRKMSGTFPTDVPGHADEELAFMAPEQIPSVIEALLELGYADGDIQMVLGGNLLRLAEQVWK